MLKLGEKKTNGEEKLSSNDNFLVLSIDQDGKIRYFNKECEKIIGYYKNEILDKNFDILIPDRHYDQWKKLFESVKNDKKINDFKLPWLTKKGQEILARWSIAPVGKDGESTRNIGVVGELIDSPGKPKKDERSLPSRGDKEIIFKEIEKTNSQDKNRPTLKLQQPQKIPAESIQKTSKTREVDYKEVMKEYDSKKLEKTYEEFNKTVRSIKELEKKNKELEQENKKLDKTLKKVKKPKKEKHKKQSSQNLKKTIGKWGNFLINVVGINKKREEFKKMVSELDERKQILKNLESQLNQDKINLNKNRKTFVRWRERLEQLEDEVEKRRTDLINQEEQFEQKLIDSLKHNVCVQPGSEIQGQITEEGEINQTGEEDHHEMLDKIPQGAIIIQRGILKQVNQPFTDITGFKPDEVVEKSFFDFIAPEGLSGIEQYYIDRLKGEQAASYDTILITNDEKIMPVEINIKPMYFNGDKADMIIINSSGETIRDNIQDSSKPQDTKEEKPTESKDDSKKEQYEIDDTVKKMLAEKEKKK